MAGVADITTPGAMTRGIVHPIMDIHPTVGVMAARTGQDTTMDTGMDIMPVVADTIPAIPEVAKPFTRNIITDQEIHVEVQL